MHLFLMASDPELHCLMDWETLLPKCFLKMPLKASVCAIALSEQVMDCWHRNPVQQQYYIRRLEQPDVEFAKEDRSVIWATVVQYGAFEVGIWMVVFVDKKHPRA